MVDGIIGTFVPVRQDSVPNNFCINKNVWKK